MDGRVSREEIRRMVRELLRDAVADGSGGGAEGGAPPAPQRAADVGGLSERVRAALDGGPGGSAIEIAIAGDSDLNGFAQQVALCALERDLLGAIASNRVRFRLAGSSARSAPPAAGTPPVAEAAAAPATGGGTYRWEQGLLNETRITEIARTHAKLELGRRALLTPLAWDRVHSLGLHVTRMKS